MAEGATPAERTTGGKEAPGIPGVRQAAVAKVANYSGEKIRYEHPNRGTRNSRPRGVRGGIEAGRPTGRVLVPGRRGSIYPHVEISTGAVRGGEKAV